MNVNLDKIIEISINILNEEGIKGLSVRKIASRLNIKPSSLYWHIKNKEEIYNNISSKIYSGIKVSENITDPRKYLFELNKQYRRELRKIKDSTEIIKRSQNVCSKRLEYYKVTFICIKNMGIVEKYCLTLANMMNNYVLTFEENSGNSKRTDNDDQFYFGLERIIKGCVIKIRKITITSFAVRGEG